MIKNKPMIMLLLLFTVLSVSAQAQEFNDFHLAAELNIGVGIATQDGDSDSDTGIGISIRPGYQIDDQWILMLDIFSSSYSKDNVNTKNNGFMFAGQYYLQNDMYVRPSLGFSKMKFKTGGNTFGETDLGLALGVAGGYEIPLNEFITAGPVARIIYNNIADDGGSFWNIAIGAEIKATF